MAECDWIILCDYAFPAQGGKLSMIGVFDLIFAAKLPVKHERAAIGFTIVGEPGENVHMKLEIIGPLGEVLLKAEQSFVLPDGGGAHGHIDIKDLILKDYGRHAIQMDLGDGPPKSAWFTLKQVQDEP